MPSYNGSGLVNLVAEIELRMTGSAPSPGLSEGLSMPDAPTYVLVLFDGLGVSLLGHEAAGAFRSAMAGSLDAPFPTTTSVSLSTIASGLPPSRHGQVGHLVWYPDLRQVVNTLKWVTPSGDRVGYDYPSLLPRPNLWERLRAAGAEPITVQPGDFAGSPLTRMVYRGARFEGAWDPSDLAQATVTLASVPGRLIFTYVPFVDVAGHVTGLESEEFSAAMKAASQVWEGIASRLPPDVVLVGTADHGLVEIPEPSKILVRDPRYDHLRFAGDARGVQVWGDPSLIETLASEVGARIVDPVPWLGPDPTEKTLSHLGDRLLVAPPGTAILPRGFDKRLRCYHGGLTPEESEIPLLLE